MDAKKLIKAAGLSLTILGILHLLAHFLGPKSDEVPLVIEMMQNYKIELMGTHTLMSFHNGFSIMTGLFMISLGTIQLAHSSKIDRSMLRTLLFFTTVAFVISLIYFHPLAYGLILIGMICQLLAIRKA